MIVEKNNHNYRYIAGGGGGGGQGNKFLRINPDIEVWWEKDRVRASHWTPQGR